MGRLSTAAGVGVDSQRTVSIDEARRRAWNECRRLGLEADLAYLGVRGYEVQCVRLCRDGREVAVGFGKGPSGQAGAYFEALERFYTSASIVREAAGELRLLRASEVAGQASLSGDGLIPRWADEFADGAAACTRYQGESGAVWYPTFLVDRRYESHLWAGDTLGEYRSLLRYCSNIGTAAGVSRADAALHAVCELIEHDSLSLALLRWFIVAERELRLVRESSLPHPLADLLRQACAVSGAAVHLVEITIDSERPTPATVRRHTSSRSPRPGGQISAVAIPSAASCLGLVRVVNRHGAHRIDAARSSGSAAYGCRGSTVDPHLPDGPRERGRR